MFIFKDLDFFIVSEIAPALDQVGVFHKRKLVKMDKLAEWN